MTDLRDLLNDVAGPGATPSSATIDQDLARGRTALRRHRLRTRSVTAVAAGMVAVVVGGAVTLHSAGPAGVAPPPETSVSSGVSLELVAYTADQPEGFEVGQVPAGWSVRSTDATSFVIAPPGGHARQDEGAVSFVDAVAVTLSSTTSVDFAGAPLRVDSAPAVLRDNEGGGRTLFVARQDGRVLEVQVWDGVPLSQQQVLDLAGGIVVTGQAAVSHG